MTLDEPTVIRSPARSRQGGLGALLLLVVAVRVWVALAAPVIGQEAYHWEYAVHPDLSYFDHPPMTGWAIAAGTWLLGNGPLGIRLFTLLFAIVTTLVGVALVRDMGGSSRAQRMWVVSTLAVPILGFGMNLAMTEGPLMCGWMLAVWGLWRARDGALRWWLVTGVGAGLAVLSKYTSVFLLLGVVGLCLGSPRLRFQLRRAGPWLAGLVVLAAFAPIAYWNAMNDWASFRFQATSRYDSIQFSALGSFESVAGQLLVLTPLIGLAIAFSNAWWVRRLRADPRSRWVLGFGLPLPLFLLIQSPWVTVKLNWMAPAYPILLVGLFLWADELRIPASFPRCTTLTRVTAGTTALLLVASPVACVIPASWGNGWSGWEVVASHAEGWEEKLDDGSREGMVFFFSFGANETAVLDYWLHRQHTELSALEPVLPESVLGGDGLAFDYWTAPAELAGKNAIAVITHGREPDNDKLLAELKRYFVSVEMAEEVDVELSGVRVQTATIWTCHDYVPPVVETGGSDAGIARRFRGHEPIRSESRSYRRED